jgi:hypothetical protein
MFLRVVDTVITQEIDDKVINVENSITEGVALPDVDETELSGLHGESLSGEPE